MPPDYQLIRLASCPSTNEYLKADLPAGIERSQPICVLAAEQSAGRGRLGRSWSSPRGGVYLSLLWPQPLTAEQALSLPPLVAVAARSALQPLAERLISCKWPNDLLMPYSEERRKLAGILVELVGGRAIIGIGVNVVEAARSQPVPSGGLASAYLLEATGLSPAAIDEAVDKTALILIKSLLDYLGRWQEGGCDFGLFVDEYRDTLIQLGEFVEIRDSNANMIASGIVQGVDDQGRLVLQSEQGLRMVSSGEITLRTGN